MPAVERNVSPGVLGYAAMALLGLTGSALCLRRKEDEIA